MLGLRTEDDKFSPNRTLHDVHQDAEYPGEEEHGQRVGEPGDNVGGGRRGEGDEQGRPVAEEVQIGQMATHSKM